MVQGEIIVDETELTNFLWRLTLRGEKIYRSRTTGATEEEYKYGSAEKARKGFFPNQAFVTFEGVEYGPEYISNGSLEEFGEPTSTVLIKTNNGIYWKLWFFNSELN
jgi:hypothetical protein